MLNKSTLYFKIHWFQWFPLHGGAGVCSGETLKTQFQQRVRDVRVRITAGEVQALIKVIGLCSHTGA